MKNYLYYIYWIYRTWPLRRKFPMFKIMTVEDTINDIINNKKSISRFGDGEFRLLTGERGIFFQNLTKGLSERLFEVINSTCTNLLIGLPYPFISRRNLKRPAKIHWLHFINQQGKEISAKIEDQNRTFGDAFISRFYMDFIDKKEVKNKVKQLKKIWNEQNILFIEGEFSRLGIGNDFFSNANSVQRIICPSKNAFENYDEILKAAKIYGKGKLCILALGPTATVLAYDLAKENFWALDLGHIDIEYSWFSVNAENKIPVDGKKSAEVQGNEDFRLNEMAQKLYDESIILEIK